MRNITNIILASFIFISSSFAGGPWAQPKGVGYFKLSEWWLEFNEHYTDSGELDPNITTGIYNTTFYAEYGLTDRFTGIIYAPLFSRNYYNNQISATTGETLQAGEAVNSIGDIDVSLKYGLTNPAAKFQVATTLTLGLPLGSTGGGELGILQTGDGEFNQTIQIDAGTGFQLGKSNAYFSTFAGVNNRTNGFSEEFRYGVELGIELLGDRLWIIGRLNGVESFNNGDREANAGSTSVFADRAEFTSYGLEVSLNLTKRFGISAAYASAFRGKIIAAAPSYSVGVFYDMSK